jgi:hypothetical protein
MKTRRGKTSRRSQMILKIIGDFNLRGVNPTTEEVRQELVDRGAYEWDYGQSAREQMQKREIISTVHKARDGKIMVNGQMFRVQSMDVILPDGTRAEPGWKQENLFDVADFVQVIGKKIEMRNQADSEIARLTKLAIRMHGPDVQRSLPFF